MTPRSGKRAATAEPQPTDFQVDLARYGPRPFLREWSIYAVAVYRFGQWNDGRRGPSARLLEQLYWLAHRAAIVLTHVELPKEARIGPGLRLHHSGPVVIHPDVVIGPDCTIRHGVTVGERRTGGGVPVLGASVELGAYSQVLGRIRLGDRAKVGAMALVLDDVPDDGTAVAPRAQIR